MINYRIIEKKTTNGKNEVISVSYYIEKRFYHWWFKYKTPCCRLDDLNYKGVLIDNVSLEFSTYEDANNHMNDFCFTKSKYKIFGFRIIRCMQILGANTKTNRFYFVNIDKGFISGWKIWELRYRYYNNMSTAVEVLKNENIKTEKRVMKQL